MQDKPRALEDPIRRAVLFLAATNMIEFLEELAGILFYSRPDDPLSCMIDYFEVLQQESWKNLPRNREGTR